MSALTKILRLRLRMMVRARRKSRNAGSFLRKELPDRAEDRSEKISIDLTPLSSVASGATRFWGRRLWHFVI